MGRVLAVRLDALGDVLMTTPALRALKGSGRHLTLLTSPSGSAAAALVPEVDEVIVYEAPWLKATPPRPDSRPEYAMAERLRAGRFDAAVVFTVYTQNPLPSALLCWLAGVPLRLAHCRENPYQLLTDWVPEPEPDRLQRHEVRRQLDLVAAVGARAGDERLSLRVPEASRRAVARHLRSAGVDPDRPWLLIHPGATAPSRRYPPGGFAEAARLLTVELGYQVVFTGSDSEHDLIEGIRGASDVATATLAGRLDLGGLAALIERAPVLVSNNTGPVHVAAAVGTPVAVLYALTNLQHTPWAVPSRVLNHDVPCKLCYKSVCPEVHHDCLRKVPPGAIVRAVRELADGRRLKTERQGEAGADHIGIIKNL
ncbi:MAG: glycosyltransferase family 9 protein [Planctomycetia bacterium]|nr:glycosyltransferase family 9 protein [Planctomycetia bacterium]